MLNLHADGSLIASLSLCASVFGVVGAVNSTMGPGTKLVLATFFEADPTHVVELGVLALPGVIKVGARVSVGVIEADVGARPRDR